MGRNNFIIENAIDARWFLELKRIKTPLLLHAYASNGFIAKDSYINFITNPKYNPGVSYPNLDLDAINTAFQELSVLRNTIVHHESNKSIQQIYTQKIDEMQLELNMQKATLSQDWSSFLSLNQRRFGKLDQELVDDIFFKLHKKYPQLFKLQHRNERIQELRNEITTEELRKAQGIIMPLSVEGVDEKKSYDAAEIKALWDASPLLLTSGWKCEISEQYVAICINTRLRRIYIPSHAVVKGEKMQKLYAHEIGVHVRRRLEGKNSQLQLLSTGLPGYEVAEEGLALMVEQVSRPRFFDFGGHDKYVALALATGLYDGTPRDFKDTFSMLVEYFYLRKVKKHGHEKAHRLSNHRAWNVVWRIFRGADPAIPGLCFMKDKIYREGNAMVWRAFLRDSSVFAQAYQGKFNFMDPFHAELVKNYGSLK